MKISSENLFNIWLAFGLQLANYLTVANLNFKSHFEFTAKNMSYSTVQQPPRSILWAIKHHNLSTPQALLVWCSDLAIQTALKEWKIGENKGRSHRILTRNELILLFGFRTTVQFHQNWLRIETIGDVRQKDASDFIICPMLCYSNGTVIG